MKHCALHKIVARTRTTRKNSRSFCKRKKGGKREYVFICEIKLKARACEWMWCAPKQRSEWSHAMLGMLGNHKQLESHLITPFPKSTLYGNLCELEEISVAVSLMEINACPWNSCRSPRDTHHHRIASHFHKPFRFTTTHWWIYITSANNCLQGGWEQIFANGQLLSFILVTAWKVCSSRQFLEPQA